MSPQAEGPDYAAQKAAWCGPGFMTMSDYRRLRDTHDAWVKARDAGDANAPHWAAVHDRTSREIFGRLKAEWLAHTS